MLGVSVVAADDWILRKFASSAIGDITRLNYAKRLLQVPIAVLGQAVGQASLPFFARIYSEGRHQEFAARVNGSISKLASVCLLATSGLIATSFPLTDLAFRRGHFSPEDTAITSTYFTIFSLSLLFWAVQGLYARAFYAARDMMRPMVAGTIVTAASVPVYYALFHLRGVSGLAFASNLAIVTHTLVLAVMLHARRMVRLEGLDWLDCAKSLLVGVVALALSWRVTQGLRAQLFAPLASGAISNGAANAAPHAPHHYRYEMLLLLALAALTWSAGVALGLWLSKSKLLALRRRAA